ncbi:hypothetical protein KFZ70_15440 [Tamlana fucoidanivorans]|uniref:Outer membrane protein beta-barrel domain-containing protein n=1 Tax=Allotamlana fucoidanivorans TaxID=2583814 RepID=A0A5C4SFR9_9FLAO|nr:DUF6048 family protein [Tamlana fucoidanivorans]TNJ42153.1 hypothetical protein FGF67_14740 [Tamlana fucoidanivorans]
MIFKHTSILRISILVITLVLSFNSLAQNDSIPTVNDEAIPSKSNDASEVKLKYGLRLGVDIGKIIRSSIDDDYTGFEILGDFRLKKDLYIAAELGTEERNTITDYLDITTSGSYLKAGIDYNMYENWLDMDNMIFAGFRVGASTFSHDLNSASIYTTNQYWSPQLTLTEKIEFKDLTAFWAELMLGIKAELFTNFFMGLNVQLKFLVNEKDPGNFANLYIPGFNKNYDGSSIGVGYSYTLSYRIPLYQKTDKKQ